VAVHPNSRPDPAVRRSELEERWSPPELAPYPGWCGSCAGWFARGAVTRYHFLPSGAAQREHAACSRREYLRLHPPAPRRSAPVISRQPAPALEPGG
jgi:hypothetical protein